MSENVMMKALESTSTEDGRVSAQFNHIFDAVDFFELTAMRAARQQNTPWLRLNAHLGSPNPPGVVSWPVEDDAAVRQAWT